VAIEQGMRFAIREGGAAPSVAGGCLQIVAERDLIGVGVAQMLTPAKTSPLRGPMLLETGSLLDTGSFS